MDYFPAALENLVEQFAKLPGVGRKSAQRLAFYILEQPEQTAKDFAAALLEANPPAGESYTVEELAAILRSVSGPWSPEGSCWAFDVLNGEGETVNDFALLMAMECLCRRCGIAAEPVEGEEGLWLIVGTPQGSRHLLPEFLRPVPPPEGGEEPAEPVEPDFRLYTDRELTARGYEWATSLYPVCLDNGSAEGPEAG